MVAPANILANIRRRLVPGVGRRVVPGVRRQPVPGVGCGLVPGPDASATAARSRSRGVGVASLMFALVAALLAFSVFTPLTCAFAAEGDNNVVDPTQRADNSFIYDTTVASLFDQASLYEDRTVQVVGEVIGDRISAGQNGYLWITLTAIEEEDKSSISVLMSEEQTRQIDRYGRYGVTGTTLQVRGTYHQACSEHDGLPDIHATASSVLSRGVDRADMFRTEDFVPGIVALLIGGGLMALFYVARERTR